MMNDQNKENKNLNRIKNSLIKKEKSYSEYVRDCINKRTTRNEFFEKKTLAEINTLKKCLLELEQQHKISLLPADPDSIKQGTIIIREKLKNIQNQYDREFREILGGAYVPLRKTMGNLFTLRIDCQGGSYIKLRKNLGDVRYVDFFNALEEYKNKVREIENVLMLLEIKLASIEK